MPSRILNCILVSLPHLFLPLPKEREKQSKGKDGLDLTSRLKAKALHYLISFSFCLYLLVNPPPSKAFPPTSIPILMYATSSVSHAAIKEQTK